MEKELKKRKRKNISLRKKSVTVVLIASIVLSLIAVIISGGFYAYSTFNHYKELAEQLADTAASQLSAKDIVRYYDEVKLIGDYDDDKYWSDDAYRADYDKKANALKDEKYKQMLNTLFVFADQSKGRNEIKYIYVQVLEKDKVTYIFDADHTEDQYQLGTVRPVSTETMGMKDREYGVPAFISNTPDDGWLCSCMRPVLDDSGNPVALVGVDISMFEVVNNSIAYLVTLIAIILIAVALLIILILRGVDKAVVRPINSLSHATRTFVEDRSGGLKEDSAITKLDIKTGDEIETLCDSVKQMELDINSYITNLTAITAEKERIGAELELATKLQADMLPNIFPAFPERDDFDIFASMTPAKEVGGDFYDFFLVDDNHLAIVMADVSGKGIPAALFMMMSKILIQNTVMSGKSPGEALTTVNNQICANNREEMFVTVWLGIVDLESGVLTAANAGHEKPIIKMADGDFEFYQDKHGFVIGGMSGINYKEYEIQLQKGSKLFIYTDGVAEATDSNNELYGVERTLDALNSVKDKSPQEILNNVKNSIDEFVGTAPQFDDLTMLCFDFAGIKSEITLDATHENVAKAVDFVGKIAEKLPFSVKHVHQLEIVIDEVVCNVASYAYGEKTGTVTVRVDTDEKGLTVTVTDNGVEYNPLEREDPDTTLPAEERGIGGYGIFLVKKLMDKVEYVRKDGINTLSMRKNFS